MLAKSVTYHCTTLTFLEQKENPSAKDQGHWGSSIIRDE
jgi:hypothetical protein